MRRFGAWLLGVIARRYCRPSRGRFLCSVVRPEAGEFKLWLFDGGLYSYHNHDFIGPFDPAVFFIHSTPRYPLVESFKNLLFGD